MNQLQLNPSSYIILTGTDNIITCIEHFLHAGISGGCARLSVQNRISSASIWRERSHCEQPSNRVSFATVTSHMLKGRQPKRGICCTVYTDGVFIRSRIENCEIRENIFVKMFVKLASYWCQEDSYIIFNIVIMYYLIRAIVLMDIASCK